MFVLVDCRASKEARRVSRPNEFNIAEKVHITPNRIPLCKDAFNTFFSETGAGKHVPRCVMVTWADIGKILFCALATTVKCNNTIFIGRWIWSLRSWMRSVRARTVSCSTRSSSSPEKKLLSCPLSRLKIQLLLLKKQELLDQVPCFVVMSL